MATIFSPFKPALQISLKANGGWEAHRHLRLLRFTILVLRYKKSIGTVNVIQACQATNYPGQLTNCTAHNIPHHVPQIYALKYLNF